MSNSVNLAHQRAARKQDRVSLAATNLVVAVGHYVQVAVAFDTQLLEPNLTGLALLGSAVSCSPREIGTSAIVQGEVPCETPGDSEM